MHAKETKPKQEMEVWENREWAPAKIQGKEK
jgi:hypothetical protein